MIKNPKYKGKWQPPMIDNPNYQVCLFLQYCQAIVASSAGDCFGSKAQF